MRTVIIYESIYGNTHQVAEQLADVARSHGDAVLVPAEEATRASLDGADLLLVGGPTHVHGILTLTIPRGPMSPDRACATGSAPSAGWTGCPPWRSTPGVSAPRY
jgi:flavorubredoxin